MDIFYLYTDKFELSQKHEREHELGRYIVEYAAKKFFNIKDCEIEVINKKPQFKYSDLHFSISHTRGIVAVCFDKNEVGFDVELIKPRNYLQIAKRLHFDMKGLTLEEFYKCWTSFEAVYKLQGKACNVITKPFLDKYMLSVAISSHEESAIRFHLISNRRCQRV